MNGLFVRWEQKPICLNGHDHLPVAHDCHAFYHCWGPRLTIKVLFSEINKFVFHKNSTLLNFQIVTLDINDALSMVLTNENQLNGNVEFLWKTNFLISENNTFRAAGPHRRRMILTIQLCSLVPFHLNHCVEVSVGAGGKCWKEKKDIVYFRINVPL